MIVLSNVDGKTVSATFDLDPAKGLGLSKSGKSLTLGIGKGAVLIDGVDCRFQIIAYAPLSVPKAKTAKVAKAAVSFADAVKAASKLVKA